MLVREKQAPKKESRKGKEREYGLDEEEDELLLGYAIVMAEMDSVKWVFSRLRSTLDESVSVIAEFM